MVALKFGSPLGAIRPQGRYIVIFFLIFFGGMEKLNYLCSHNFFVC